MTTANFQKIDAGNLFVRNGAAFYRITPAKGARVDGAVSVGVTSHEAMTHYREPKLTCPAMWVDYTPMLADESYAACGGRNRVLITVNGREYGEGFGESVSGRVEFLPAENNQHLAKYYPVATVAGSKYYLRASVSQFDHVTDKAREALNAVAAAIAAEFVTDERWHAYQVDQAQRAVSSATEDRDKAQAKLDEAVAVLDGLLK